MELIEQNLLRKENCHTISAGQLLYYQERKATETFSPFSSYSCMVKVEEVRDRGDHLQLRITAADDGTNAIAQPHTTWNIYHYYSNPEPLVLLLPEPPAAT